MPNTNPTTIVMGCQCRAPMPGVAWMYLSKRPDGETDYGIEKYDRTVWECAHCGHFQSGQDDPLDDAIYREATYGKDIHHTYETIFQMLNSDNIQRISRVIANADLNATSRILDVGGGLGVFTSELKDMGHLTTYVDLDPVCCHHALSYELAQRIICADFNQPVNELETHEFDLITFNHVLQLNEQPGELLRQANRLLAPDGLIYVEVNDGANAKKLGPNRQEFHIENIHAFSKMSLHNTAKASGFHPVYVASHEEPSGKLILSTMLRHQDRVPIGT